MSVTTSALYLIRFDEEELDPLELELLEWWFLNRLLRGDESSACSPSGSSDELEDESAEALMSDDRGEL